MEISELIVNKRTQKGLSRRKLCDLIGYSEGALRSIESGNTKKPSLDIMEALSAALDIPIGQLLGREEPIEYAVGYDEVRRQAMQLNNDEKKALMRALLEEL